MMSAPPVEFTTLTRIWAPVWANKEAFMASICSMVSSVSTPA